jgi:hypothetical protein
MNTNELLASIRRERARLDGVVARVGEARMTEPSLEGGRSVKDVLAHISAWEKIGMALVRNNQPLQAPPPGETGPSTDLINEKVYEGSKDRPLADVIAEAKRSYADLLALVEAMSEDALQAVLGAGQEGAEHSPRAGEVIGGNSDEHYREHAEQIAHWLDRG